MYMTKEEWREVARIVCPQIDDDEFDQLWAAWEYQNWRRTLH